MKTRNTIAIMCAIPSKSYFRKLFAFPSSLSLSNKLILLLKILKKYPFSQCYQIGLCLCSLGILDFAAYFALHFLFTFWRRKTTLFYFVHSLTRSFNYNSTTIKWQIFIHSSITKCFHLTVIVCSASVWAF